MRGPPLESTRRYALQATGVAGAAFLAGCLTSPFGGSSCSDQTDLSFVEATDAHISNEFSRSAEGLPYATNTAVTAALETGEATSRGYYSPELRTDYVFTDSQTLYYRVETSDHDAVETTGYEYSADIDIDPSSVPSNESIHPFSELPVRDRESIHSAIGNQGLLHAPHYTSFSVVFTYEHDDSRADSLFVPETDVMYVEWDDVVLRLEFEEQRSVQITSTTVTTERVATSLAAFAEYVGQEYGIVLEELTSQQRDIVTQAIEDGYTECESYSEPFADILDELSTSDREYASLARYESALYFVHVS